MDLSTSIVIRCYNEEQHIGRLLSGIIQQSVRNVEIIIVDSGSTDATLSIASRYPVKILSIPSEEFSFGRSLNIGCKDTSFDTIVIVSAHVYPLYKDWLARLLAPLADSNVALVYGRQLSNESTRYSEQQVFAKWYPKESDSHQGNFFCNNANAVIRRSLWEQLPYDEMLTGLEDIDWGRRATRLGYKIAYAADAEVVHVHNESAANIYNRYKREAIAMKRIFPQERFSVWDFAHLCAANIVSDCYNAWHDRVLLNSLPDIVVFRLMQFWGTYRGFTMRGPVTSQLKQRFYYPNGFAQSKSKHSQTDFEPGRPVVDYTSQFSPLK